MNGPPVPHVGLGITPAGAGDGQEDAIEDRPPDGRSRSPAMMRPRSDIAENSLCPTHAWTGSRWSPSGRRSVSRSPAPDAGASLPSPHRSRRPQLPRQRPFPRAAGGRGVPTSPRSRPPPSPPSPCSSPPCRPSCPCSSRRIHTTSGFYPRMHRRLRTWAHRIYPREWQGSNAWKFPSANTAAPRGMSIGRWRYISPSAARPSIRRSTQLAAWSLQRSKMPITHGSRPRTTHREQDSLIPVPIQGCPMTG